MLSASPLTFDILWGREAGEEYASYDDDDDELPLPCCPLLTATEA